jgi:predicted amidohydrolase
MSTFRIALANLPFPATPEESIARSVQAIERAGVAGAQLVCFPEAYVPGYRTLNRALPATDRVFLERAWQAVSRAAASARVGVVLGTERVQDGASSLTLPLLTALVIQPDGTHSGFQDKVQLDPSEESTYAAGTERHVFRVGACTFGICICHEGWRYPETVRWAARRAAQLVLHLQFHEAEPGSYRPTSYGDPANSFHEKAVLCRAAENTVYFATANYAGSGSPTTSAIVRPDGTLLCYQPYGEAGLLLGDLDLDAATGLLASRYKPLS